MEAIEMIKSRRSVRKYKDEVVDRGLMEEIIEIVRYAPSWGNSQTARWTLVDNLDVIEKFAVDGVKGFVYNMDTLRHATGVAVLSFVEGKSGKLDKYGVEGENTAKWEVFDSGIACQTFCLTAHAKGVATCVFGVIDEARIAELLGLSEKETVSALIVYGYAEGETKAPRRMEVSDILRWV
ncbi:MAG: nitroreductase family protein [Defluviitaleaceae bacterium]|nr:nitroreductase family protein [Defluviitaleaceae bacterium]